MNGQTFVMPQGACWMRFTNTLYICIIFKGYSIRMTKSRASCPVARQGG